MKPTLTCSSKVHGRWLVATLAMLLLPACNSNDSLETFCHGKPCPTYFESTDQLRLLAEDQLDKTGKCEIDQGQCGEYRYLVIQGPAGSARAFFDGEGQLVAALHPLGSNERKYGSNVKCNMVPSQEICTNAKENASRR